MIESVTFTSPLLVWPATATATARNSHSLAQRFSAAADTQNMVLLTRGGTFSLRTLEKCSLRTPSRHGLVNDIYIYVYINIHILGISCVYMIYIYVSYIYIYIYIYISYYHYYMLCIYIYILVELYVYCIIDHLDDWVRYIHQSAARVAHSSHSHSPQQPQPRAALQRCGRHPENGLCC